MKLMKGITFFTSIAIIVLAFIFVRCNKDDEKTPAKGEMAVKITDAPIDDANIKGAFVTVAAVKVDGKTLDGFQKQTIDLTAYHKGDAKLLLMKDLDVGSYQEISIVLDYDSDDAGNQPGCYVLDKSNVKHNLVATADTEHEITAFKAFDVMAGSTTNLILDVNLRKAMIYDNTMHAESNYAFVSEADLDHAMRAVIESSSGEVKGTITESASVGDRMIVYVYEKGTYDEAMETSGQGDNHIKFYNAVTSCIAAPDGNYNLAFLESGEYEIHVASYAEDSEGKLALKGMAEANSLSDITLNNLNVQARSTLQANINITGLLNL